MKSETSHSALRLDEGINERLLLLNRRAEKEMLRFGHLVSVPSRPLERISVRRARQQGGTAALDREEVGTLLMFQRVHLFVAEPPRHGAPHTPVLREVAAFTAAWFAIKIAEGILQWFGGKIMDRIVEIYWPKPNNAMEEAAQELASVAREVLLQEKIGTATDGIDRARRNMVSFAGSKDIQFLKWAYEAADEAVSSLKGCGRQGLTSFMLAGGVLIAILQEWCIATQDPARKEPLITTTFELELHFCRMVDAWHAWHEAQFSTPTGHHECVKTEERGDHAPVCVQWHDYADIKYSGPGGPIVKNYGTAGEANADRQQWMNATWEDWKINGYLSFIHDATAVYGNWVQMREAVPAWDMQSRG